MEADSGHHSHNYPSIIVLNSLQKMQALQTLALKSAYSNHVHIFSALTKNGAHFGAQLPLPIIFVPHFSLKPA